MKTAIEPILSEDLSRFVLHPIKYQDLWEMYKKAQASFWVAEEIDLSKDVAHWNTRLSEDERKLVSNILAFFACSDGIVAENLAKHFCSEVTIPEARCFYGLQIAMENVHAEVYSMLLSTFISNPTEQTHLFNAAATIPSVKTKADWALKWISDEARPFSARLVAFAAIEGIFFSSSFAVIFWLKERGVMPGLTFSNELISRDEGLHMEFACLLMRHLQIRPSSIVAADIIREAVRIEKAFIRDSLPVHILNLNAELMCEYVEFVADRLLIMLGYNYLFNTPNPLIFMDLISMDGKANFFERKVSSYRLPRVGQTSTVSENEYDFPPKIEF